MSVVQAFDCPLCSLRMTPPIQQCQRGHSFCGRCINKGNLDECPTCDSAMTSTRNYHLEDIIKKFSNASIKVMCRYKDCKYELNEGTEIEDHEASCKKRSYSCPGKDFCGWKCDWVGVHEDISQHLSQVHKRVLLDFKHSLNMKIDFESSFSDIFPVNFQEGQQLFLFKHRRDAERKKLYWIIEYVGPKKQAKNYYYELEIHQGPVRKFKYTDFSCSDVEDTERIFKTEQCVVMSFETVKNFVDEKNCISYRYRIMKIKKEAEVEGNHMHLSVFNQVVQNAPKKFPSGLKPAKYR